MTVELTAARQVADALLYEGYLLYPYRASAAKNQLRWQFGVLGPVGAHAAGVGEPETLSCDVVMQVAADAREEAGLDVLLRFLQVQERVVQRPDGGGWRDVDTLQVGEAEWVSYHEAAPREVRLDGIPLQGTHAYPVVMPGGQDVELLGEGPRTVGRLLRTRWPLSATLTVKARPGTIDGVVVLTVTVHNDAVWEPSPPRRWSARDLAARTSLVGTHLLLTSTTALFASPVDPPEWAEPDAPGCTQERCWPVLVSADDGSDAVLVSPIVLGDHPQIAPESAGDLFDATEIDEILTLRIRSLTDAERAAARGTDPRAAAILARCDALQDGDLARLHGGRRATEALGSRAGDVGEDEVPWWDAGHEARAVPERDTVQIAGSAVGRGSRVLLRPTRRADAQDLFLAGLTALVTRVYFDVDGATHLAVVLEDDPGADLYDATGRYYYFAPEEVEPLSTGSAPR